MFIVVGLCLAWLPLGLVATGVAFLVAAYVGPAPETDELKHRRAA